MPRRMPPVDSQARILTERVRGVFDDLLGKAAWSPPKDWGRTIVTFPEPGAWEVLARFWHWDNPGELHLDHPRGLFVVSFIGSVASRSGGTLVLSGSPRLLIQQERRIPADQRRDPVARPWIGSTALTPGSWRSRDRRRHLPTGSPLSWTGKPSSKASPFAWPN